MTRPMPRASPRAMTMACRARRPSSRSRYLMKNGLVAVCTDMYGAPIPASAADPSFLASRRLHGGYLATQGHVTATQPSRRDRGLPGCAGDSVRSTDRGQGGSLSMTEQDRDWPDENWAREAWPEDGDEAWPRPEPAEWPGGVQQRGPGVGGGLPRLAIVAVVGLAVGVTIAIAVKDLSGSSPASTASDGRPNPGQSYAGSPGTGQPGGSVAPGQPGAQPPAVTGNLMIAGKVTAVSPRSITISAGPQSVTAQVTAATHFSGTVTGIAGVRPGDMVVAQITVTSRVDSLVTLQDPASLS